MNPSFHAGFVKVEETGDCLIVGFADQQVEGKDYLLFQRARQFDEQDRRTGMAEVYAERNDQRWSVYGGMESVEFRREVVRVCFNDRGAVAMGGMREMEISFEVDEAQFETLRADLKRCFEGFGYYVDRVE